MHEMSIVEGLMGILQETAALHKLTRIDTVRLRIGAMRQVVPESLEFAFEALGRGTVAQGARIEITEVPVRARCGGCGAEFTVDDFSFFCASCGGNALTVFEGKELYIESLEGE
jgi:hydrogenase nickel incorporation protein HypA/HybF